jgi:DNA-binding transcriptional regulator YdaS (Cro superfamily)
MTPEESLDKAIAIIGSLKALANELKVTKGAIGQWKIPNRRVPAEHCPTIERLTNGQVRCENLRPDIEWSYLRATAAAQVPSQEAAK